MNEADINFKEVLWYAERANAAYQEEGAIRASFPSAVRVADLAGTDVRYFVEAFPEQSLQVVSVRGTANLENAKEDADYLEARDGKLGIYVHRGFELDTAVLYADVVPFLKKEWKVRVTGHSLGAAIATLLMMYLHDDGYVVEGSINFGQPKLTNARGVAAYGFLPLLRVVDENDLVPRVPPATLLDSIHGVYEHLGKELVLLEGNRYAVLEAPAATRKSALSFWENLAHESLTDHYMANYLGRIRSKLAGAVQVGDAARSSPG